MPIFNEKQLTKLSIAILKAAGVPEEEARLVTRYLVEANLVGFDSHGIMRISGYIKEIKAGRLKPGAGIKVIRETPSSAVVNGNNGLGQFVATKCMEMAIKKAEMYTIGCVVVHNLGHIGRLADYSSMAIERGMIGVAMHGDLSKSVAPFGGIEAKIGTNPISVAIPSGKEEPFVMDFATSVIAEGKIRDKLQRGSKVPEGWIIDKEGRPTTNPADLYAGGAILPFGGSQGYKASGLAIVALLGGLLSGATGTMMIGDLFAAVNVKDFILVDKFKKSVDKVLRRMKSSKPMPGLGRVMTPGEPEIEIKKINLKKGIDVPDSVWKDIVKTAKELKIDVDELIKQE